MTAGDGAGVVEGFGRPAGSQKRRRVEVLVFVGGAAGRPLAADDGVADVEAQGFEGLARVLLDGHRRFFREMREILRHFLEILFVRLAFGLPRQRLHHRERLTFDLPRLGVVQEL